MTRLKRLNDMSEMQVGDRAKVLEIGLPGSLGRRLQDMGLIPGTVIRCVLQNSSGEFKAFRIRGAVVAVRAEDAGMIRVAGL